MRTTFDLRLLEGPPPRGSVISIGVFDGLHLGHQAILRANLQRAAELDAVPTVVTFRRHPKRVILGRAPRKLTPLEHRLELLGRAGVQHAVALAFDERLRQTPAEDFVRETLVEKLGARSFVLGFDSKFGRDRRGSATLLREMGLDVHVVPKVIVEQRAVSSTAIREAVELGDLEGAARMLGRPVSVLGTVVRGAKLGQRLGFPTANLDLHDQLHPPVGVWAGVARRVERGAPPPGEPGWPAVANIGYRPTVGGGRPEQPLVEVHLLDASVDLYGARLELEFVGRIRAEQRFPDLEALRTQIERDVQAARDLLQERGQAPGVTPAG